VTRVGASLKLNERRGHEAVVGGAVAKLTICIASPAANRAIDECAGVPVRGVAGNGFHPESRP